MSKDRGGKIRGFFFEIEGDAETLQEGLKNFGSALGRALSGPPRPARAALPNDVKEQNGDAEEVAEELDGDVDDDSGLDTNGSGAPKKKSSGTRKPPPLPEVIEVDLDGANGVSLKDFATQKKPGSISDKFLVVAAWFKDHGGTPEITADHVFTCFKVLGWTPHPANYAAVLSDLKRKQKSLDKGETTGGYKINLVGMNAVAKMGTEG